MDDSSFSEFLEPGSFSSFSSLESPKSGLSSLKNINYETAFSVDHFVSILSSTHNSRNVEIFSSEDDSDVLNAAEDESKDLPLRFKSQVLFFDKRKKCSRFIETQNSDSEDSEEFQEEQNSHSYLLSLLKTHQTRKERRRKLRKLPDIPNGGPLFIDSHKQETSNANSKYMDENEDENEFVLSSSSSSSLIHHHFHQKRKRKNKRSTLPDGIENIRGKSETRKRLWLTIAKKDVSKALKNRNNSFKERVSGGKRVAAQCMRLLRSKALSSQKSSLKETISRAKRLSKEMTNHWRKIERADKVLRRLRDKEAEEARKYNVELLEARRQQRKLNFLITQTELYAHFMASKLGGKASKEEGEILKGLEEEEEEDNGDGESGRRRLLNDDYNVEVVKNKVRLNVVNALKSQNESKRTFDSISLKETTTKVPTTTADSSSHSSTSSSSLLLSSSLSSEIRPNIEDETSSYIPSKLFKGTLKGYQVKGLKWLVSLYDQGINGILADEMGLGKTVQALSLLATIAETYGIWGPYLVITPASTLHNWQQEMNRFIPEFKVVPYWGSPSERKILRHFWDSKNLHTQSASFHVVITSYTLVISDFKYFNRIQWQYLVLDEAQAIKSSSSQRWKILLEFKCRNRLLLSGTPIQNSMAELWSLLHFVMPSLFDSHVEFNDWFSKDIESTGETKDRGGGGHLDDKQIRRLHLILKPFMLRRLKKDVENELTEKLEVLLYVPLSLRQKLLYSSLKKTIKNEKEAVLTAASFITSSSSSSSSAHLYNLVMQFRKVCNHPELFERREPRSPFFMVPSPCLLPKSLVSFFLSRRAFHSRIFTNLFCIYNTAHVHASLHHRNDNTFSYLRHIRPTMSVEEHFRYTFSFEHLWNSLPFSSSSSSSSFFSVSLPTFISRSNGFLTHGNIRIFNLPKTKHSIPLSRVKQRLSDDYNVPISKEFEFVFEETRSLVPLCIPRLLLKVALPLVYASSRELYVYDVSALLQLSDSLLSFKRILFGERSRSSSSSSSIESDNFHYYCSLEPRGLKSLFPPSPTGWSHILIPDKETTLVHDAGKLFVLDSLLIKLKESDHRVLIYSQMTRMIDLLEEYMIFRHFTYIRLDGSSKIHERRDMVADFQGRSDIFVFLLSTRAGGLGINLTAADTVIFYDSDWNPTVDQQAMDRAHRLGQTKQVTVYRLITKGTIEERILQRAKEKSEIQRMVIQGGKIQGHHHHHLEGLKTKEVVSLLLDDEEMEERLSKRSNSPISEIFGDKEKETNEDEAAIFDFLGDKLGPVKKGGRCGKRGRPPKGLKSTEEGIRNSKRSTPFRK